MSNYSLLYKITLSFFIFKNGEGKFIIYKQISTELFLLRFPQGIG